MSKKPIYVLGEGAIPLMFTGGAAVAIRPIAKGEKLSVVLLEHGRMTSFTDQRINGLGIERYIQSLGYVVAAVGDKNADRLNVLAAVQEGLGLIESASVKHSVAIQKAFAGQRCTFVPFAADKATEDVVVEQYSGSTCVAYQIGGGLSSGCVKLDYSASPAGTRRFEVQLSEGWIAGPNDDAASFPRNSEYGGLVELAAFVIANSGVAILSENRNLLMPGDADADDAPYPRGHLVLNMAESTDRIMVIIDGGDELHVNYVRDNGDVVCSHHGLEANHRGELTLPMTIGCIASVIVHARDLDERKPVRTPRLKAA